MTFRDEYETELEHLYALCEELGRAEPELAPILGRNADPSVSRLVEGLAFSFGRLRQRLDDDLPQVVHPVIENLCPDLLRPVPSSTVMALFPTVAKLMSKMTVNAGATFTTKATNGVACIFQSTADVEVVPWSVSRIDVQGARVRIELEVFPGVDLAAVVPRSLRLFFAHPVAAALEARDLFLRRARTVEVRAADGERAISLGLPRSCIASHDGSVGRAFLDVRSYFVNPQAFAFVELPDFERVRELGPKVERLHVDIGLAEAVPRGIFLDPSTVLVHAVPARNVFAIPDLRVPFGVDKKRCEVRPAIPGAQVYSIGDVALVSQNLHKTRAQPWARFFGLHGESHADGGEVVRYEVRRTPSVIGQAVDVTLSFGGSTESRRDEPVAVEVGLYATNGERAAGLAIGDVNVRTSSSPSLVSFRNVTSVTRTAAAPLDGDYLWRIYRLFKTSLPVLVETLAEVLTLANLPAKGRWPGAKPDATTFVPLVRASYTRRQTTVRNELRALAVVTVVLDPARFEGVGDVYLLGEVLVPLLASTLHPRQAVELVIVDPAGAKLAEYPATEGTRFGL